MNSWKSGAVLNALMHFDAAGVIFEIQVTQSCWSRFSEPDDDLAATSNYEFITH